MFVTPSLSHCSNRYKLAREGEKDKGKDYVFFTFRMKSSSAERGVFSCCLKIDKDPAFRIGVGRLFHQPGMVNENVLESDNGLMTAHSRQV